MPRKLSKIQRRVLSEVDWLGPSVEFTAKSNYVRTIKSLTARGLITAELSRHGLVWKCTITDQGLYALREGKED